jgi:hypothetical protein
MHLLESADETGDCRRFCSGQSTSIQLGSTAINNERAMETKQITLNLHISGDFNNAKNLVRDQVPYPASPAENPLDSSTGNSGVLRFVEARGSSSYKFDYSTSLIAILF